MNLETYADILEKKMDDTVEKIIEKALHEDSTNEDIKNLCNEYAELVIEYKIDEGMLKEVR